MAHVVTNVAEYAIILNEKNEFLLVQWDAHYQYSWHFPGGRLDENEGATIGLIREMQEELKSEITDIRPVYTRYISNEEIKKIDSRARDRYAVFYLAKLKKGFVPQVDGKEHIACKWYSRSDLATIKFWLPFYREMLEQVLPK